MTIQLQYALNNYNSDQEDDYTENRFLLGITLQTERPWRW
jgi:hypothetical protein